MTQFKSCPDFVEHDLGERFTIFTGRVPDAMLPADLEEMWRLRPAEPQYIQIHGRRVEIPRRQKAYGRDYHFSGQVAPAAEAPSVFVNYLDWAQGVLDSRLNGLLVNWYDGSLGNYIGPHHDDVRQLVSGSPIVTISLGEERVFRLTRKAKPNGAKPTPVVHRDFVAEHGGVIVIPWDTNRRWKHSVPRRRKLQGRRISITVRAFE